MTDYLLDNRIVDLELNDGKGWRGSDLSFLANLTQLQSFKIIDLRISFATVAPKESDSSFVPEPSALFPPARRNLALLTQGNQWLTATNF